MLLVPRGSVAINDVFSNLAVDAASVAVSDGSFDKVETNIPLVEEQVHVAVLVKLGRNVNGGHGLVSWLLPRSALSAGVDYRLYDIKSGFIKASGP